MARVGSGGEDRWGIILAGGGGTRLQSLTRRIAGDDRPKQFCPILGEETLLEQTQRRTALAVSPDRTTIVLTRAHRRFYGPTLSTLHPGCAVIQPESRGTAPAILYALLRVAATAPAARVAIFPSDHYVSDGAAFMAHVEAALWAVQAPPELVVILGVSPDGPEVEYGWIEPADPASAQKRGTVSRVRRFWEKPSREHALALWARGCLWNSFVMVGRVSTFLSLIRRSLPDLAAAFEAARPALGTAAEGETIRALYARLRASNFSREVLAVQPEHLAVLPVLGVRWCDWGEPGRVLATLARLGARPAWMGGAPEVAASFALEGAVGF